MPLAVTRQEHDRQPRKGATRELRGRLAPRACDRFVADIFQARQVVDTRPANDAEHGLGHDVSRSTQSLQCSTILRRNNQALSSAAKGLDRLTMSDREKR